jgi:hypothetical protein
MPSIKMTINLPEKIREILKLAPWGNRQATSSICKSIDRYNLIIESEKKYIKELFSLSELNLFYILCKNDFIPATKCKDKIILSVTFASDENILPHNKKALLDKLKNLTLIQNVALVEVIEDLSDSL